MPEEHIEIVAQYVSDMLALEKHILEALEHQLPQTALHPNIQAKLQGYIDLTKLHLERLLRRLNELGSQDTVGDKAKEGVANLFGQAAGVIDRLRIQPVSKNLRDDYTAGMHAVISYVMLRTTALGCGDEPTASLAETHAVELLDIVTWVARAIPGQVIHELEEERGTVMRQGAAGQVIGNPRLESLFGARADGAAGLY